MSVLNKIKIKYKLLINVALMVLVSILISAGGALWIECH